MSCSSQYSTTSVTKAVVCTIMLVKDPLLLIQKELQTKW